MTTGAPIFLVSACSSGEEFIAAFRRYADRNGLFVPIADPIPAGRTGRFALTLRDGGVMIEGDAEVISSARTTSVLHGRVGMTIRFTALDDPSRTVITELERARLSMKPPPPSVPPRPADVPATPRAVPPAPAGRVDATNALAECVAIGDVEALPPLDPAATRPVRAATKPAAAAPAPVRPAPAARSPSAPMAVATAAATATAAPALVIDDAVTAPAKPPRAPARDSEQTAVTAPAKPPRAPARDSEQTAVTAPAKPQKAPARDSEQTAVTAPARAPTRDSEQTAVAVPPSGTVDDATLELTEQSTIPIAPGAAAGDPASDAAAREISGPPGGQVAAIAAGAPTIPNASFDPAAPAAIDAAAASGPTGGATAPVASRDPLRDTAPPPFRDTREHAIVAPAPDSTPPPLASLAAAAPLLEPPPLPAPPPAPTPALPLPPAPAIAAKPPAPAAIASPPPRGATPATPMPIVRTPAPRAAMPAASQPVVMPAAPLPVVMPAAPLPVVMPAAPLPVVMPAAPLPVVMPAAPLPVREPPRESAPVPQLQLQLPLGIGHVEIDEPTDLTTMPDEPVPAPAPAPAPTTTRSWREIKERRTVLGIGVSPVTAMAAAGPAAPVAHAPASDGAVSRDTSLMASQQPTAGIVGPRGVDAMAPTLRPDPAIASRPPAIEEPTPSGDWTITPGADGPTLLPRNAVPKPAPAMPSGDWTISLASEGEDGWSEPSKPGVIVIPQDPALAAAAPRPAVVIQPGPPQSTVSSAAPIDAPSRDRETMPEPKVQIDPTLIEPLQEMPLDDITASGHAASAVAASGSAPAIPATPAMPPRAPIGMVPPLMAAPAAGGFGPNGPHGYALDPGQGMSSGPFAVSDSAPVFHHDPRDLHYPSAPTTMIATGRRRVVVIVVSAAFAVAVGIALLFVFGDRLGIGGGDSAPGQPGSPGSTDEPDQPSQNDRAAAPGEPATLAAAGVAAGSADGGASPEPAVATAPPAAAAGADHPDPATGGSAGAPAKSPPGRRCFADISSTPPGADILIGEDEVGAVTPHRLALPCDEEARLVVRKGRASVQRTVRPTPEGVKVRLTLAKPIISIRVSSTPTGAKLTMNGKFVAVTPTTLKVTANESSMLVFSKEGFVSDTQRITPKANNATVHANLKRAVPKQR